MTGVVVEQTDGVLRITMNEPDRLNALTSEMLQTIGEALETSAGTRVAVLTGAGRAFCSGAALAPDHIDDEMLGAVERAVRAIVGAPFPVVAAINGLAVGVGSSLALACDLQVAKRSGYFLQAFVNIGLMPDGAANALVTAAVGRPRAMRLLLGGDRLDNEDGAAIGLISHCVADEEWESTLGVLVEHLATGSTLAYARTKAAVNAAALPVLDDTLLREMEGQTFLSGTDDFAEGVAAFSERRRSRFTGQ